MAQTFPMIGRGRTADFGHTTSKIGYRAGCVRILHLNQFSSHQGGIESYIAEVAVALQAYGHESHLIAFAPDEADESILTTTYAPVPDWPSPIDAAVDVLNNVIAKFRPDVAYLHGVYHPGVVNLIAGRLPTVAYVHAPYPVCPGSAQYLRNRAQVCPHSAGLICLVNAQRERCCWGRNPIKHVRLLAQVHAHVKAYQRVRTVLVGSHFMQELLQRGGFPKANISILAPILISGTAPVMLNVSSNTILFAGRLTPEKGLRQLIEALALLDLDWQLVVAGDGAERALCQTLAEQRGIAHRIEFIGWQSQAQMITHLQQCACVAYPSLWPEPFGRTGPEAFIHGRPVAGFATGGIGEWLIDGVTGYVAQPGDIAGLSQRIRSLLASPETRLQMGQRARAKALDDWNAAAHVEQLTRFFQEAIVSPHENL